MHGRKNYLHAFPALPGEKIRFLPVQRKLGVMQIPDLKAEIFYEDGSYVALCPALNVSSYGDSMEAAKQSLAEAVEAFIEECNAVGTLEDVLEDSGYDMRFAWMN